MIAKTVDGRVIGWMGKDEDLKILLNEMVFEKFVRSLGNGMSKRLVAVT